VRKPHSYARSGPVREPYDSVLIVCEGRKTEPSYLNGVRTAYRLSSANIRIAPANGNDPLSIAKFALAILEHEKYDRAFCVFDRDGHVSYNKAIRTIAESAEGKNGCLCAITSVPCFEIWVLLHFCYSSAPFNKMGSQSACDRVMAQIRNHFVDYSKGHPLIYDRLSAQTWQAIKHAQNLEAYNIATNSSNPATQMHKLVDYLCNLKKIVGLTP